LFKRIQKGIQDFWARGALKLELPKHTSGNARSIAMKSRLNNPPGDEPSGTRPASRERLTQNVRRIEVTVEREVISVLHRHAGSKGQESNGPETCAFCGQTLPGSEVKCIHPLLALSAEAVISGTKRNEKPKE
jgi:hypothetical protein